MARKKKRTIGKMTNSRVTWSMDPVTCIVKSKKVYDRNKYKNEKGND